MESDPQPKGAGRYVVRPGSGSPISTHGDAESAIAAASMLGPGRHLIEPPPIEVLVSVRVGEEPAPPAAPAVPPIAAAPELQLACIGERVFHLCRNRGGEPPMFRDWAEMWKRYTAMQASARIRRNVVLKFVSPAEDYGMLRYGLCTALLGDGGFSLVDPHGQTNPWFDEYDQRLGEPIDPVPAHSVTMTGTTWMRRYQGGLVLVNTSAAAEDTIAAPAGYRRINGQQDPAVNSGATAGDVRMPPRTGLVLVKVGEWTGKK